MNQQVKNKRKFPYVAVILWVTVALVVAVLGHSLLDTIGVYGMTKAGKSTNIRLNENHVDVYRYHVAQNQLYYQYMYVQYGMASDPTGGMISAYGWTAEEFISYMIPLTINSGDYDEMAYEYAEQYLTYCEGAKSVGLYDGYKAEISADIDAYVNTLKQSAKNGNITFTSYLTNYMGNGVSEKDLREAMEYYYIGAKYAEKLADDFAAAVTDDQKTEYRDNHKESFYTSTYTAYKLVNNNMAEAMAECKTVDDVKAVIVNYYVDLKFDDNYNSKINGKNLAGAPAKEQTKADVVTTLMSKAGIEAYADKAVFTDKETEEYKKAAYEIVKAIDTSIASEINKITKGNSIAYVEIPMTEAGGVDTTKVKEKKLSDLQVWLFGTKDIQPNDYKLIKTESTSTGSDGGQVTTISHTWYLVEESMVLDTERTQDMYYFEMNDDKETVENGKKAQVKAQEFQKALAETNPADRVAKFKELVKQLDPTASTEMVDNISKETLSSTSEELANWLYDEARVEFDVSNVVLLKGDSKDTTKVTSCVVALYMGENEETWKITAANSIAGEKLTEWYNKAVKDFNVKMDYTPAETTAATTTAQ